MVALALALPAQSSAGRLYKWTDEEGRIHYADSIPPEYVKQEHSKLDERGIVVDRIDAAKTKQQLQLEAIQRRLQQEQQALIDQQKAADRVLLRTFRSEDDIIMARDGQLRAVDLTILMTQTNIKRIKNSLLEMQQNAAALELSGETPSPDYLAQIDRKRQALKAAYQSIVKREQDKNRIRTAFARDQARFRELKHLSASQSKDGEAGTDKTGGTQERPLNNVFECSGNDSCNSAWSRAKRFLRNHATTPVKMLATNIVMTGPPVDDHDISITISRIRNPDKRGTVIFMDLQCKDSPAGNAFCNSKKITGVKRGFIEALSEHPTSPDKQ
ncbi:DUF4124 domain-containing protein [Candidatus Endoriftia persephone]|nr:DUF4124 domain-containing protein [Candidatus Endoriftia persephone]USF87240.1 DUF4124 domain-containing protein [Candidatus Endoriftia persephone]